LSGGGYDEIPFEKQVYELEGGFSGHPAEAFSVEDYVKARIRTKRF
jgi:hypothetical protein